MKKALTKLVIDGQIFQTEARDRGMGRYSVCLVQALLAQVFYGGVEMLFTKNIPHDQEEKEELTKLFPGVEFSYLDLLTTDNCPINKATSHNERLVKNYVAELKGDENVEFLIPSPFQEPVVSVFPAGVKKLMVFYDLIPYLYHPRYQPIMRYEDYLKRFRSVFEADRLFAISKAVADDLHVFLGIPKNRLVSIDGAPIRTDHTATKPKRVEIPEKFVLMPTSDDPRKNNLRAVLGFEEHCATHASKGLRLVITSKIHKREMEHLKLFSNKLIFTGNLREPELNWLYEHCQAVLFVPESEGLGLPILEAVEANKQVACSSIPVFKEISDSAFYYCDHENQSSIAEALSMALSNYDSFDKAEYKRILAEYNWPQTARRFIAGAQETPVRTAIGVKPRVAIFTPTPDGISAIGKVVAESHPVMAEYFDIDYYAERGLYGSALRPNYLQYVANYNEAGSFSAERYAEYDAVIYHIGNGDYHLESIMNGLYLPGYVIIHDTNIKEAYRVLHETGMMSPERLRLEEVLNDTNPDLDSSHLTSLLNSQLGILSHSEFAKKAAEKILSTTSPVVAVNLPSNTTMNLKERNENGLAIGLAGIIADVKGIGIVEAIAGSRAFKDCSFRLFGISHATQETIDRLNSYENIAVTTNLTDFDFQNNVGKLDVFVNYRLRYHGETSLSTIEAMRQGVVVIVKNVGWYSELPDDTVIKVSTEDDITKELQKLRDSPELLQKISECAKAHIAAHFSHEQYAEGLLQLIRKNSDNKLSDVALWLKQSQIKSAKQYLDKADGA